MICISEKKNKKNTKIITKTQVNNYKIPTDYCTLNTHKKLKTAKQIARTCRHA